tara:strand:- start:37 stop:642 length:606 start_codon:yes stop_codon:yes gene_type:complete
MKILELFSGTKSFSKVARERGHECFTVDFIKKFNPNLCIDILDLEIKDIPFKPDIIWASPPCTFFSVSSIGKHWNKDNTPKTKEAELGIKIIKKTILLIKDLNPKLIIIENPRGKLRKLNLIPFEMITVCYCKYGDKRMKPTDLWNNFNFKGKMCKNGNPCHISAPRGSKTGTQGLKGSIERSKVPKKLCLEIIKCCERVT